MAYTKQDYDNVVSLFREYESKKDSYTPVQQKQIENAFANAWSKVSGRTQEANYKTITWTRVDPQWNTYNQFSDWSEELVKIYTGEITNWKELGGEDEQIVVIGREAASGTRGAFEELLEIEDICVYSQELDSTGAVLAKVASTPGAIGYVSLDVVDDTVLALSLDEVEATEENIVAGNYVLSRPFVMATMGEIDDQEETVKAFFEFVQSEEGQNIIKGVGLILPQ